MKPTLRLRSLIVALMIVGLTTSCLGGEPASEVELQEVEDAVRVAVEAENEKDVDTFLDYWTDEGLKEYDVGSRAELEANDAPNFGADPTLIFEFSGTDISGDEAATTVDAVVGEHRAAWPLSRVRFTLIKREGVWLINGFQFVGGTPAPKGTEVFDIDALEYSFVLERDELPSTVGLRFENTGKEAHEMTFFKGPDDLTLDRAKEDLKDVDGHSLDNVPEGYVPDHVTFAEPGKMVSVTFSRRLPGGTYVLACYLPQGSGEHDEEDPDAKTHFELGMVTLFGVR